MLEDALDRYFANFESTLELTRNLIHRRKHPIEALILLCARLDAMASNAATEGTSRKKAFASFVTGHSGKRDLLSAISIGDLYYELAYHQWLLEGTITAPGRLHRFSSVDDPIIHLLDYAGLPLTLNDSRSLLETIMRILKRRFRAMPRQSLSKPRFVKTSVLIESIIGCMLKTRLARTANNLHEALGPLLESKKISIILYERFRSESIHGATVVLDSRRFFSDTEVYWKPMYSEYYGSFELIEFPARFLLSMLEQCMKTYRSALLARGKIPPDVHFHAFGDDVFSALDCLDETLLPESGDVRFKIGRNR